MDAEQIRKQESWTELQIHVEICAQLAELNEKFADYFETLEPSETDTKRGIR